jgi:hypothetical protein
MELLEKISFLFNYRYSPLNFNVDGMQVNILLMCKLLFALLCVNGFIGYIEDPYIPFIVFLDVFNDYPGIFITLMKSLIVGTGVFLFFNYRVRFMSILLGLSVIIILLSSKSLFRNHLFICGCVFLLAGLTNKEDAPWLLYVQLSLVYFGAVLNKVFQLDWWTGQFMYNWLFNARENETMIFLSNFVPALTMAKILSWSSLLIETSIAILILIKKLRVYAVWFILVFHTLLYTLTAFRFGHFYEDIVIIALIFLNWPKNELLLKSKYKFFSELKTYGLLPYVAVENSSNESASLFVQAESMSYYNWNAIRKLLLYNTNFYLVLFFIDILIRYLFNGFLMDLFHIGLVWVFVIFFFPLLKKQISQNLYARG